MLARDPSSVFCFCPCSLFFSPCSCWSAIPTPATTRCGCDPGYCAAAGAGLWLRWRSPPVPASPPCLSRARFPAQQTQARGQHSAREAPFATTRIRSPVNRREASRSHRSRRALDLAPSRPQIPLPPSLSLSGDSAGAASCWASGRQARTARTPKRRDAPWRRIVRRP